MLAILVVTYLAVKTKQPLLCSAARVAALEEIRSGPQEDLGHEGLHGENQVFTDQLEWRGTADPFSGPPLSKLSFAYEAEARHDHAVYLAHAAPSSRKA